VLKFNFLLKPTFFLTLILFVGLTCQAQFGPISVKMKFQQPDSLYRISLQTVQVPDSTLHKLVKIGCGFQSSFPGFFWAISNSGAILAFKDSLLEKPLFLEKRNIFPFVSLKSRSDYWLETTRSNGNDGYLAARLFDRTLKVVVDEVFLCLSKTNLRIREMKVYSEPWMHEDK